MKTNKPSESRIEAIQKEIDHFAEFARLQDEFSYFGYRLEQPAFDAAGRPVFRVYHRGRRKTFNSLELVENYLGECA